jgi:hypothetical protein
MKINEEIKERIRDLGIPLNDGLAYLLAVYFNCVPSTTSLVLVKQMSVTKILSLSTDKQVSWNIPLFVNQVKEDKWDWVISEYRELFRQVNSLRSGPKSSCISRMKKFFQENPEVRKDDVIGATKMYIRNLTSSDYITSAHYFIFKGTGANKISGLEDWVDKYKSYTSTLVSDQSKTIQ